jgi:hypothetical protein
VRTLHGIEQHEKLVARGQYHFTRDGQVEHRNLHTLPGGVVVVAPCLASSISRAYHAGQEAQAATLAQYARFDI